MKEVNLTIRGMSCGGCVNKVSAALKGLPGVKVEKVAVGSATVMINTALIASDRLIEAISSAGFTAEVIPASKIAEQAR